LKLPARLAILALLCILAYGPSLRIPLIEDDYVNLSESQAYGAPSQLPALFHHAVYRVRATSFWSIYPMFRAFGVQSVPYHVLSLALHILNTWLLFAIGLAWPSMRRAAFWAAAFFAVHEGHQEAVMWFTAIAELWSFFFGAIALWCWQKDRWWGAAALALALVSKESSVVFLALFVLVAPSRDWRKWLPYAAVAAVITGSIFLSMSSSFRFSDGSFSLHAPFWITWPRGVGRVLWIWGWLAGAVIWWLGDAKSKRASLAALAWIVVSLAPYIFWTYSTEIPSRETYIASAGLAFLFGLAITLVPDRRLVAAIAVAMVVHNVGYLWTKKRGQFLQRAEPTNQLIQLARSTPQPIRVRCFPLNDWTAKEAVRTATGRPESDLVWTEAEARARGAVDFCFTSPSSRRRSSSPSR
jgi:hypothetical protein